MPNKPVKRFVVGSGVCASIWENQSKNNGAWYSVTITRSYRDGDEYKDSTSFRRDDLLFVAKAASIAFDWCLKKQQRAAQSGNQQ